MKKTIFITLFIFIIIASTVIFAMDASDTKGYSFKTVYEGGEEAQVNVPKKARVSLVGTDATPYEKVRIKVEIEGPAKPEILATDSQGVTYDIAKIGYWGPETGFKVGGTFENVTPVTVTYPQVGTYVTTLSLVDVSNEEAVIISDKTTVNVTETPTVENNTVNNTTTEIPQTGISIWVYIAVILLVVVAIYIISKFIKNK